VAVTIRPATPEDAPAITEVHVASWRHAYRGLIPDHVLDDLSVEEREAVWREGLAGEEPGMALVAEDDTRVIGFVGFGPGRSFDAEDVAEIYAIYLDPEYQRRGIGRRLLEGALHVLAEDGFREATLWVLESNTAARRFYESLGWTTDEVTRHERIEGAAVDEVRYRRSLAEGL
jgi:ribosomal protein S18 acetylase RimI-like enzyme